MEQKNILLSPIAEAMPQKLQHYSALINTSTTKFVRIINPRLKTEILNGGELLPSFVSRFSKKHHSAAPAPSPSKRSFLEEIMEDYSIDVGKHDENLRFLLATMNAYKETKPLICWNGNSERFPNIAVVARRVIAI